MSNIIDIKDERKKKNKKKIITNMLFLIATLYIIYAIYLIVRNPTDTITVNTGTLTVEESATGYVIRDETVVQGDNYKNGIYQIVAEGEKAAKNQVIFRYYGKNEEEIQSKIDEIDVQIQEAMKETENSIFSSDIETLEEQITETIQNLRTLKDTQTLAEYKKDLSEAMLKKAKIIGEESQSGSYIKKLIEQREQYEEELTGDSEYMKAPISGIVSYKVDELEEVLTPDSIENLTEEDLESLDLKTGKIISTNDESAKVINNFNCYIATILKTDIAQEAQVGDVVKLTLSSESEIEAEVYYLKKQDDGNMLVVFEIDTLTEDLILYRKISINITWWSYSGMKVSNDAILEDDDGLKYVIKKESTGTEKILVKVLKKTDQYSIISNYSADDLDSLGIDSSTYTGIDVYDTLLMYPE